MAYPLELVEFNKNKAENLLDKNLDETYQHKHHESRFTRFYEDYWLPKKGYEKEETHFQVLY